MRPHSINLAATIKPKTVTRTCSVLVLSASLAFIASAIVLSKHVRRASEHCKLQVLQALQSSIAEHCIAARRMSVARAGVVAARRTLLSSIPSRQKPCRGKFSTKKSARRSSARSCEPGAKSSQEVGGEDGLTRPLEGQRGCSRLARTGHLHGGVSMKYCCSLSSRRETARLSTPRFDLAHQEQR